MGIFSQKKESQKVVLPAGSKCCRCGRAIKNGQGFVYIEKKIYCEKCYHAKRDWDFLAFHALIDD